VNRTLTLARCLAAVLAVLPGSAFAQTSPGQSFTLQLNVTHSVPTVTSGAAPGSSRVKTLGTQVGASATLGSEDKPWIQDELSGYVDLFFYHPSGEPGWPTTTTRLRTDLRPPLAPGQSQDWYPIALTSDTPGTITLGWGDLAGVPASVDLVLLDPNDINGDGVKLYSLRSLASFSFPITPAGDGSFDSRLLGIRATNVSSGPVVQMGTPVVSPAGDGGLAVTFDTLTPTTGVLEFGLTPDVTSTVKGPPEPSTHHVLAVGGLNPSATYYLRVRASAPGLAEAVSAVLTAKAQGPFAFTTQPVAQAISLTGATIQVETSDPASVTLAYGTDPSKLDQQVTGDQPGTNQNFALTNLLPGTAYTVRVTATAAGKPTLTSTLSFMTLPQTQFTVEPTVSNLSGGSATITFGTNVETTASLQYGETHDYGLLVEDTVASKNHTLVIPGLTPGTTYHYRVLATSPDGGPVSSDDLHFTAPLEVVLQDPVVSQVTAQSAVVSFSTDLPSTATVEYGPTDAMAQSVEDPQAQTSHMVTLSGLEPSTNYQLRVRARAVGVQEAVSRTVTFRTLGLRGKGDVSGSAPDGQVDMTDVRTELLFILGGAQPTNDQSAAGDMNNDGVLNLRDVVLLVRKFLGLDQAPPPGPPGPPAG
jgi:hypothetical protein